MTFLDIIALWPSSHELADDLGLPVKNVRRWIDIGSIPSEWFVSVERAAKARGLRTVNLKVLSQAAHDRRLAKLLIEPANDASPRSEAA